MSIQTAEKESVPGLPFFTRKVKLCPLITVRNSQNGEKISLDERTAEVCLQQYGFGTVDGWTSRLVTSSVARESD